MISNATRWLTRLPVLPLPIAESPTTATTTNRLFQTDDSRRAARLAALARLGPLPYYKHIDVKVGIALRTPEAFGFTIADLRAGRAPAGYHIEQLFGWDEGYSHPVWKPIPRLAPRILKWRLARN